VSQRVIYHEVPGVIIKYILRTVAIPSFVLFNAARLHYFLL